jgi:hypothetical protein
MALVFTISWLFIERLGVVMLPVLAVLGALVVGALGQERESSARRPGKMGLLVAAVLVLLAGGTNLATTMKDPIRTAWRFHQGLPVFLGASDQSKWQFQADLIRWITAETPGPMNSHGIGGQSPLLANAGLSPQLLLYTGRPVVLNSQFENLPIRQRYERYLQALFSTDEAELRSILEDTQARYLILERTWALGRGPGTVAYMAGQTGPVDLKLNISRLHFAPEDWNFLQPVFSNEYYRVFAVADKDDASPFTWERLHASWWNLDRFTAEGGVLPDPAADLARLGRIEKDLAALQDEERMLMATMAPAPASRRPSLPAMHQQYMEMNLQKLEGRPDLEQPLAGLIQAIGAELQRRDPRTNRSFGQTLAALYTRGGGAAERGWQQVLAQGQAEPTHLASAAQLAVMMGQYDEGADLMSRAAAMLPLYPTRTGDGQVIPAAAPFVQRIRQSAVWYDIGAGRTESAIRKAKLFLPWSEPGSAAWKLFSRVAALGGN